MPVKLFTRVLFGAYLIFVGAVVFWPTPVDRPVAGTVKQVVTEVQQAGATGFTYSTVEISTNVLMFVPLGLLIVLVLSQLPAERPRVPPRLSSRTPQRLSLAWVSPSVPPWLLASVAVIVCAALSTTIELLQREFLPDRVASVVDVAANTLGGALGAAVAWGLVWWARRRRSTVSP